MENNMLKIKVDEDFILEDKNNKYYATIIIGKFGLHELYISGKL